MSKATGTRLLFRVEPFTYESPGGYLCRTAQIHGYHSAEWLAGIAGVLPAALDREDRARQIAYVLRLEPKEWLAMCYRRVKGGVLFQGERIGILSAGSRRCARAGTPGRPPNSAQDEVCGSLCAGRAFEGQHVR